MGVFVEQPLAVASSAKSGLGGKSQDSCNGCIGELKGKGAGVKRKRLYIGWFLFQGFYNEETGNARDQSNNQAKDEEVKKSARGC